MERVFQVEVEGRLWDTYLSYSVEVTATSDEDAIQDASTVVDRDLGAESVVVSAVVLPPDPDRPETMTAPVRDYIARLQTLTADVPFAERFNVDLPEPGPALAEGPHAEHFSAALAAQRQRWRDELTNAEWDVVVARNPQLAGIA